VTRAWLRAVLFRLQRAWPAHGCTAARIAVTLLSCVRGRHRPRAGSERPLRARVSEPTSEEVEDAGRPAAGRTMATREQMANARDARPGHDQDRRESTADAAAASAATVPWGPAGIVYPHGTEWVADDGDADRWDGDDPAGLDDDAPSNSAPSLLRRAIPLLWAAALTVAALQHAGEVERRAALREPSSAELDMQDRAQREIKAAWRSVGTVAAVTERTPTVAVAEEKPVLARVEEKPTTIVPERKPAATIVEAKPVLARVEEKPTAIVPEKKAGAAAV
jgi:hypothetical protein